MRWLDAMGVLHRPLQHARRRPEPSLQLRGDAGDGRLTVPVDLPALADRGVALVGRLTGVRGSSLTVADDLAATAGDADIRLRRMLTRIDRYIAATGLDAPAEQVPTSSAHLARRSAGRLDLAGIRTVIWATGYRRSYPWLHVPVLRRDGEIDQIDGATPAPGLFALGLPNQTRRSSTLLDGVRFDAEIVVAAAVAHLSDGIERRAS
jgi:putative flavoprotein involved in K+ transport